MKVDTKYFGDIEIDEKKIITFDGGLPGFESLNKFAIISNYDTEDPVPFMWLQSLEKSDVTLVLTIPFLFKSEYEFEISDETVEKLKIKEMSDVAVYSVVKITDKVEQLTYNLMSPIVVNSKNMKAQQITLFDTIFTTKESLN